ncbi:helix-turn-helix transcriptional regulator [Phosphitispora sp. TUW77]|uniref:helix-turn-helix transcriptional regulator n=1 Tax=Phosphitispora sp. TUW77 TaxID=3152361 RepID=UPI003AB4ABC8
MELTKRQEQIVQIVKNEGPITGSKIAAKLSLIRSTLRPDLTILTRAGILEARPRVGYYYAGKTPNHTAEAIHKINVGDVQSIPVVIRAEATVYDAVVTMFLEDVGTLFVVREAGALEGIISRKDLLKATMGSADIHKMPISIVMTRMPNLITTTPEEPILFAAQKLTGREVDSLPVVRVMQTDDGIEELEVVGRVTKTTITRLFVELGYGSDLVSQD